jgi:hypothetical protein
MNRKNFFDILPPKKIIIEKIEEKKSVSFGIRKGLIFVFLPLILLGVASYFALAKVKVEIWPRTQILNLEDRIIADINASQIDSSAKVIPAQILEIEEEALQEFPASGRIEKEAEGGIRIYNKYNLPVTLKAGTRFQPANKETLYFCSSSKTAIPAKNFVDIQVKACLAKSGEGEKYNIGPSKFSIPGLSGSELFFYVYGESFEPMKGGGSISQVINEDLERAKDILTDVLFSKLEESLKNKLSTDFVLLEGATKKEILETTSDAEAGAKTESFKLKEKAKLYSLIFRKSDLEKFAKDNILANIPRDTKFQTESLKIDFQPESISLEKGKITLKLKFSSKVFSDLNSTSLKENLEGKSFIEGKRFLENQEDIIKAQISAWPFWLRQIPKDIEKIELKINVDTSN